MTARECFEGLLTELSKVKAPEMLLQDFNYFFNKAVNQYINKRYNIYDVNQQTTDDLRVLKATTILKPNKVIDKALKDINSEIEQDLKDLKLFNGTYEVNLPLDYLHMLNCICIYKVHGRYKCYDSGNFVQFPAKRLTADAWSDIINNFYTRPLPERPYYYIHNVNQKTDIPTNPVNQTDILNSSFRGTDAKNDYFNSTSTKVYVIKYKTSSNESEIAGGISDNNEINTFTKAHPEYIITETASVVNKQTGESNLPRTISLTGIANKSVVEREAGVRYGNPTNVRMEIRYGYDDRVFELIGVMVDYIKTPQTIRLTQEQVNLTEDTSQIMEFSDNVCHEIINELVHLVMENIADPRLQTHIPVTQSIANPAQQQV